MPACTDSTPRSCVHRKNAQGQGSPTVLLAHTESRHRVRGLMGRKGFACAGSMQKVKGLLTRHRCPKSKSRDTVRVKGLMKPQALTYTQKAPKGSRVSRDPAVSRTQTEAPQFRVHRQHTQGQGPHETPASHVHREHTQAQGSHETAGSRIQQKTHRVSIPGSRNRTQKARRVSWNYQARFRVHRKHRVKGLTKPLTLHARTWGLTTPLTLTLCVLSTCARP